MKRRTIVLSVTTLLVALCGMVYPVNAEDQEAKNWEEAKIGEFVYNDSKGESAPDKTIGDKTYRPRSCGASTVNDYYYQSVSECNVKRDAKGEGLMDTVNIIINVVLGVVGFLTVGVIILGGISFATSQGDAAKATKAKNTILFGVIGLVIALLAFAIVNFVLSNVFKGA